MTTRFNVTCPRDSHWDLKLTAQDLVPDPDFSSDWLDSPHVAPAIVKAGETLESLYVWDTRRYVIEEVER